MQETKHIKYQNGFKYQLKETAQFIVSCKPSTQIKTTFVDLSTDGTLTIVGGYAWDGPSGPTIDTKNFMRGSLIHDALYQLMRLEYLPLSEKENADAELKRCCLADGMSEIRAWWVIRGLYRFGTSATLPKNRKKIITAP